MIIFIFPRPKPRTRGSSYNYDYHHISNDDYDTCLLSLSFPALRGIAEHSTYGDAGVSHSASFLRLYLFFVLVISFFLSLLPHPRCILLFSTHPLACNDGVLVSRLLCHDWLLYFWFCVCILCLRVSLVFPVVFYPVSFCQGK